MPLPPDDLNALVRRREEQARAAAEAEVERIVALADAGDRMRSYGALVSRLQADGEMLPPELEDRIARSLGAGRQVRVEGADADRERRAAQWEQDRAAMARLHMLRAWAPAAIAAAAALPFIVAALREGTGFASVGSGAAGVGLAVAVAAAGVLVRLVARAGTVEGLAGLVMGAFVAGVAGLAVALGCVF